MTAGIPGSGIGGLFYFFLTLLMPLRELRLTVLGRSGVKRWATVIFMCSLCAGMLGALWGEAWLIKKAIMSSYGGGVSAHTVALVAPAVALAPFLVLGMVIVSVQVARLVLELKRLSVGMVHGRA